MVQDDKNCKLNEEINKLNAKPGGNYMYRLLYH